MWSGLRRIDPRSNDQLPFPSVPLTGLSPTTPSTGQEQFVAIGRFGTRVVPELQEIIRDCRERKQLVQGPCIEAFEQEFARFLGSGHVRTCSTEYGRMALYFILEAMDFPPGSEIIVPAFTFWVVPEIARVAGLTPIFADIDPVTFTLSPQAVEQAITPNTRAVLPTHLYGLPCDMDAILDIAKRHNLKV